MRVRESQWAAQVPWSGIQGLPPFLDGPEGSITISDVEGLSEALASKVNGAALMRLAYTAQWADIIGKPAFGSAAFANVDNFITPSQLTTILEGYTTKPQALARSFCRC